MLIRFLFRVELRNNMETKTGYFQFSHISFSLSLSRCRCRSIFTFYDMAIFSLSDRLSHKILFMEEYMFLHILFFIHTTFIISYDTMCIVYLEYKVRAHSF